MVRKLLLAEFVDLYCGIKHCQINTFVKRKTGFLPRKGALEAILGRKRDKYHHCVEVAAITCYQSLRRQQRVPGVVTFTYRDDFRRNVCAV